MTSTTRQPPPPAPLQYRGVRRQSDDEFLGLPLYSIAIGPDLARGEMRGHARGVLAVGDLATGVIAIGGLARGFVAIGGAAAGLVAIGGAAAGQFAVGGAAWGEHVISPRFVDPIALQFFEQFGLHPMPGR
jgi:hypothetical protein